MENIKRLCHKGIKRVTPDKWAACVRHVSESVEDHYWKTDGLIDNIVEQMVIEVKPNEESDAGESDSTESYGEDQMQATKNQ